MSIRSLIAGAITGVMLSISASAIPVHNVPTGLGQADYVSRVDPAKEMNLTVFLKMHDQAGFDRALEALYDPASPTFQKWFTDEDFARYAPTAGEFNLVRSELARQGFTVIGADPRRFWIRVHATAKAVETAFQTELHNFRYQGRVFQTHTRDAVLAGPASELIETVAGINRHEVRPMYRQVLNPRTGKPMLKVPLKNAQSLSTFVNSFTATPLASPKNVQISDDAGQSASYTGYMYGLNGKMGGFTPKQLQAHYGFPFTQASPAKTYDGAGQTIALVEGYGYAGALADANKAASLFGLPALVGPKSSTDTAWTFKEIYPEGAPPFPYAGYLTGWSGEIALDIQAAHALAPKAKILVVDSAGQDDEDQIASLSYIACPGTNATTKKCNPPLAKVVSNSWENDEEIVSGTLQDLAFTQVLQAGAAMGITYNFSTGDYGDTGVAQPTWAPMIPSDSPYATAVGGTTLLNQPGTSPTKYSVMGWGNNYVFLFSSYIIVPVEGEFGGGAGGGQSGIWKIPSWQNVLTGNTRKIPDVSALADPYTGFAIVESDIKGNQFGEVIGGTSLACPLFSAMWAIANQYKGGPLGFAAPYMYTHGTYTKPPFVDAVPPTSTQTASNVHGSATDFLGNTTTYTGTTLFTKAIDMSTGNSYLPLYGQTYFLSAMWDLNPGTASEEVVALSFGTDTSLLDAAGWDYVTGYGEPAGKAFVQHVTGLTVGK